MPLTPRIWQTTSVGLKRASDPDAISRVSGLELGLTAPNGAWPLLTCRGGVRNRTGAVISPTVYNDGNEFTQSFRSIATSSLGTISIPGDAPPNPFETSDWSFVKLDYSGQLALTLSRATPAMLLQANKAMLRLCAGSTTKRTKNGTAIAEAAGQPILPKYVAYHTPSGYQVGTLSSTPISLSGMDQPWMLIWWGGNSHWCDTTLPIYQSNATARTMGLPVRYAFQADCPLLIVFGTLPTSIVQMASQGGFDLSWLATSDILSILPLYGRSRPLASATEAWSAGLPAGVQARITDWYPRLQQFPSSVAESYSYASGTDTATITEAVTWTPVRAGGTKFAPLPPVLGTVRDTRLVGLAFNSAVVDGGIPTEYGPTQGIVGVDTYSWQLTGLASYTQPRAAPGNGAVPPGLQSRFDAEVDKLIAQPHWQPWILATHNPSSSPGGDIYWSNPADSLAIEAELVPLVSGARQTRLKSWLATERSAYPPETVFKMSATAGAERGPQGTPGSMAGYWTAVYPFFFDSRQSIYAAWALARYHQVNGVSVPTSLLDSLAAILNADMAEQDWATGGWFTGRRVRRSDTENIERLWAGLAGMAWLSSQTSYADEDVIRCLLARATVTRVAMAHLPRWLANAGLITLPTDLGSPSANAAWFPATIADWLGAVPTYNWSTSADDPTQVVILDQYRAYLHDSILAAGYAQGGYTDHLPVYHFVTRPLAWLLEAAVPGEAAIYGAKFREFQPHWWVPGAEATLGGEANLQQPADSYGLFLARAWLEGAPPATLEREAAYPWLASGGDLFTLHKLAEAIRAYATEASPQPPTVPPTPTFPPSPTTSPTATTTPVVTPTSPPSVTQAPLARPRISIRLLAVNTMEVTVTSAGALIGVHVSATRNTTVSYAGQSGLTGAFMLRPISSTTSLTFNIVRKVPSGSGEVFFEIEDSGGRTSTFAGAGADGWGR